MEETIEIYAAGASLGEPGPGGYAAVIDPDNQRRTVQGHEAQTNRERMEITAVLEALRITNEISPPGGVKAIIHSRSHNLTEAFTQGLIAGWKRKEWRSSRGYPLKNQDLWKQILDTAGERRITCVHLKNSSQSETAAESRRLAFKQANRTAEAPIDTKTAQTPAGTKTAQAPADTGAAGVRTDLETALPGLFTYFPSSDGTVVTTPLRYMGDAPVRLMVERFGQQYTVTDLKAAISALNAHRGVYWTPAEQDRLVEKVCQDLAIGREGDALGLWSINAAQLGDAIMRTALAVVQVTSPLTVCRVSQLRKGERL